MIERRPVIVLALLCAQVLLAKPPADWRNIETGHAIPDEGYCDQPYVVATDDGNWLCTLTTGAGTEGQPGQHIVAAISSDKGKTWSDLIDIEPATGPEASWVMPLKVPSGRVYAFYTYNANNIRKAPHSRHPRMDSLGDYVFKYSDDHGRTWSDKRYRIPLPVTDYDRGNNFKGETQLFWGVGKPIVDRGVMYFGYSKVGWWGQPGEMFGGFVSTRGGIIKSSNILTESNPEKIQFKVVPEDDEFLRAPKASIAEETNLMALKDGSLYCFYRTIDGYPCHSYSRDKGETWTEPAYATYIPDGRRIKNPRAAAFVRKFSNGKFLLWYHNHGGEAIHQKRFNAYMDRNPAWLCGGVEKNGLVHWSEPEIGLYHLAPKIRISYPDFIEEEGRYFITETQKEVARVHEVDASLFEGMWAQAEGKRGVAPKPAAAIAGDPIAPSAMFDMPKLPDLATESGFAIEMRVRFDHLGPSQVLMDALDENGKGVKIVTTDRNTIELRLRDGTKSFVWDCDPGTHEGTLRVCREHHIVVVVEARPRIVFFVVDGVFNDGGAVRQFGWGRYEPGLGDVNGAPKAKLASSLRGRMTSLAIYDRALRTAEAVSLCAAAR